MPSIVVLTSFMHNRGGDLVATINFIKSVIAQDETITFDLVIKRDIEGYQKNLQEFIGKELGADSQRVRLSVLDSSDYKAVTIDDNQAIDNRTKRSLSEQELQRRSDANWGLSPTWHGWQDVHSDITTKLKHSFESASAIVVLANPHRLVKGDYELFHYRFKKRIITLPEYSLHHVQDRVYFKGDQRYATGFSSNGVYVDELSKCIDGIEAVDQADLLFMKYLVQNDLQTKGAYLSQTTLFYGYLYYDDLVPVNSPVGLSSYIENCIRLAIDENKKTNIDIVMPGLDLRKLYDIYQNVIANLPQHYKNKIQTADYDFKDPHGQFNSSNVFSGHGAFTIRLINPNRLQRQTVQTLLNESEPWVGLTGDASWIEGIVKGKIICYQQIRHKIASYNDFLQYLGAKFPKTSPLRQFYELQAVAGGADIGLRWQKMQQLYVTHKDQMTLEAKQLAQYVMEEKDLKNTVIPRVIQEVCATAVAGASAAAARVQLPSFSQNRAEAKRNFEDLLQQLNNKAISFKGKHDEAHKAAEALHKALDDARRDFFETKTINYRAFNTRCTKAIADHRGELEQHRGWKKLCVNLAYAVLGLGVIYLAAASYNYAKTQGKHFFFHPKTDTAEKIEQIESAISKFSAHDNF